jgi:N utilization substance protein A
MANFEFLEALGQIARDQNIDEGELLIALANALLAAYKRRPDSAEDAEVEINPETGEIKVWGLELDLEGNVTKEWDATPDDFGRIAAQTAKQVLMQLIRDIQRRQMYEEFANREGDIVSGTVQQNDNRYTLLDLGRVEALLPQAEQIAFERYEHGARIKVYIVEVRKTNKGPQIVVSRTHPALVAKLFEIEVPEIANGIVEIKALAREPGHRSKIAVASNDAQVDPVGACVGARGSRVRNITNELRSERIDVVPYSDDPIEFIQAALQPARVREVRLDEVEGIATVIVHDQQLSLAIGKEGQNARLAARLTGWRIDIRSENESNEDQVVEEVWTEGGVVVDEKVIVVEGEAGESDVVVDTVIESADEVVEVIEVIDVAEWKRKPSKKSSWRTRHSPATNLCRLSRPTRRHPDGSRGSPRRRHVVRRAGKWPRDLVVPGVEVRGVAARWSPRSSPSQFGWVG